MLGDGEQPGEFGQVRVDPTRLLHHGLQRSLGRKSYFYFPFSAALILAKVCILTVLLMDQQMGKLYHLGVFSEYGGHWSGHDVTVPEGGLQFPGSQEDGWNMIPACILLFTGDYISIYGV